ncbi:MAG: hypothetical protein ACJ746_14965 [Bryobacteraceae bacterium]
MREGLANWLDDAVVHRALTTEEGEPTYREFERTVESETGAIKVQWPVTEIVVESIKTLERKKKDSSETEGAA